MYVRPLYAPNIQGHTIGTGNALLPMETPIDDRSLLMSSEKVCSGRFELYPTNNMYTFILLDTLWGSVRQVQWSTNPKQ